MSDNLPELLADLDQGIQIFRQRAMTARNNPAERQRLIRSLRQTISQIRFAKTKFPDDGDQVLLEIAEEDHVEVLRSLGVNENNRPTMRELLDKIRV
jgi:hypothetical protein